MRDAAGLAVPRGWGGTSDLETLQPQRARPGNNGGIVASEQGRLWRSIMGETEALAEEHSTPNSHLQPAQIVGSWSTVVNEPSPRSMTDTI